ncbi:hypothetical protein C3E77_01870 [Mycetocola zhujimingii]|nr:hypothetical protein C3E77_01870 [Mycetocola zhujimingii]
MPISVGKLPTEQIHLLLARPDLIGKRLATLMDNKFVADFLLQGRFEARGGTILYETGEEIFAADAPESISPGGEYPRTVLTRGEVSAARTTKWGIQTEITDEAIARQGMDPVERALGRLANTVVKHVDSVAMAVIASKVSSEVAGTGPWTSVQRIVTSLIGARTQKEDLDLGISLDTVALSPLDYANVMGLFLNAGVLPRENNNPMLSGELPPNLLGWTWVPSQHVPGGDPWVFDRTLLGGMADEDLRSPGYTKAGRFGVEVKVERISSRDAYEPRARRVTVPVVLEPLAGARLTGTRA